MVLALDSDEPWLLWAPSHGVSEMAWSPDGRRMAFVAAETENRLVVGPETKGRSVTARRITRADWRWNEVGHRDRWDQVWVGAVRERREAAAAAPATTPTRSRSRGRRTGARLPTSPMPDPTPTSGRCPRSGSCRRAAVRPREAVRLAGYAGSPAVLARRALARLQSAWTSPDPLDDEIPGLFVAAFDPDGGRPGARDRAGPGPRPAHRRLERHRPQRLDGLVAAGPVLGRPRRARRPRQRRPAACSPGASDGTRRRGGRSAPPRA